MMTVLFLLACSSPPPQAVRELIAPDQAFRLEPKLRTVCLETDSKLFDVYNWIPELRGAAMRESEFVRNEDGALIPKILMNPEVAFGTLDLSRSNAEVSYSLTLSREKPCGTILLVHGDALVIDRVDDYVNDATIEIDGEAYDLASLYDESGKFIGKAMVP